MSFSQSNNINTNTSSSRMNDSQQQQQQQRTNLKDLTKSTTRRAMNQRRLDQSNKIRKVKRSQLVQFKRRISSTHGMNDTIVGGGDGGGNSGGGGGMTMDMNAPFNNSTSGVTGSTNSTYNHFTTTTSINSSNSSIWNSDWIKALFEIQVSPEGFNDSNHLNQISMILFRIQQLISTCTTTCNNQNDTNNTNNTNNTNTFNNNQIILSTIQEQEKFQQFITILCALLSYPIPYISKFHVMKIMTDLASMEDESTSSTTVGTTTNTTKDKDANYYGPSTTTSNTTSTATTTTEKIPLCQLLLTTPSFLPTIIHIFQVIPPLLYNNTNSNTSYNSSTASNNSNGITPTTITFDSRTTYRSNVNTAIYVLGYTCGLIGNIAGSSVDCRNVLLKGLNHQSGVGKEIVKSLVQMIRFVLEWKRLNKMSLNGNTGSTRSSNQEYGAENDENEMKEEAWTLLARNTCWALSNLIRDENQSAMSFLCNQLLTVNDFCEILTHEHHSMESLTSQSMYHPPSSSHRNHHHHQQQQQQQQQYQSTIHGTNSMDSTTSHASDVDQDKNGHEEMVQWWDVMIDTCWILAYLTAREDVAIDLLLSSPTATTPNTTMTTTASTTTTTRRGLVPLLIHHLFQITQMLLYNIQATEYERNAGLKMAMIVLRIIGNIATACNGKYVPHLLLNDGSASTTASAATTTSAIGTFTATTTSRNTTSQPSKSILSATLALWIRTGSSTLSTDFTSILSTVAFSSQKSFLSDILSIANEAAWTAGTVLCDTGHNHHPSTTIACLTLVPALCDVLVHAKEWTKLDLKREVVCALWNAVSQPPKLGLENEMSLMQEEDQNEQQQQQQQQVDTTLPIRDELICHIIDENVGIIPALVQLLPTQDLDVMRPSLQILHAIHVRLLPQPISSHIMLQSSSIHFSTDRAARLKQMLEEADCMNALEGICDSVSLMTIGNSIRRNNFIGWEECAKIAANLIDDYYREDIDDYDNVDEDMQTMLDPDGFGLRPDVPLGRFEFGATTTVPIRDHPQSNVSDANVGNVGGVNQSMGRGRGRGRGRGGRSNLPAWMNTS